MKLKALTTAATAAVASMVLTLAMFYPAYLGATDAAGASAPPPEIAAPVLKIGGCHLVLRPTGTTYAPGDVPELELHMVNTTDAPVELEAFASMTTMNTPSKFARRMPIPSEVWTESCPVSLKANETKVLRLSTGTKVAAGQLIAFHLRCGKQTITAASFTVIGGEQVPPAVISSPNGLPAAQK